ncbi:MAG: dihydrofolate reductase [Candidatus Marinimicrobia bacterium]|nr:dihydrofolate reductase [Candidatus Neomarinimicrobiota bacterium]
MSKKFQHSGITKKFGQTILVSMVVARAENGVIGRDGKLPWHIPSDLQHFKKLTIGKPIVMGRKTYQSIGRPLPQRTNIVVTRNLDLGPQGVVQANDLLSALALACEDAHKSGVNEIMIIGGAQIYSQAITHADRIYLTEVHSKFDGDAFFDLDLRGWREVSRIRHKAGKPGSPEHSVVELWAPSL